MKSKNTQILLVAFAITLACSGLVLGQDSAALTVEPSAPKAPNTTVIADGAKTKANGIVTKRDGDTFTIRNSGGEETTVVITDKTKFRLVRKGFLRTDRSSNATEIRRGLRLEAEGRTNGDGQIVANHIRFDEEDLRTAQALESRVDPVETLANSTQALAENNQQRIGEAEQNAQRISGQVEELSTVANTAVAAANNAQSTADQAESDATTANARINVLDDYDVLAIIAVHFKNGSARLSPKRRQRSMQWQTL